MAVQTVTTNLNADDIGFSFMGIAASTATGMRSLYGNLTWTATTLTASAAWNGLAYGDGFVVALSAAGLTNVSLDNATTAWLSYGSIGTGTAWGQLTYGNGYFVSVNSSSATAARMSLVYQTQWATSTLPSSTTWNLCKFGGGNFVAIATGTTSAAYSSDNGATWNPVTLPVSGTWTDVEYFNGKFILVGSGTQDILTSTDGTAWTRQTAILPASRNWAALAYITGGTNGTWIITTSDVANMAYSTDNGVSWTGSLMPSAANWKAVTGGKSGLSGQQMFIAAPQSSATGAFSTDGITWYSFTCTSFNWNKLMWCPSVWKSGIDTLTIANGATVTVNTDQQRAWAGVTINNGKILVTNSSTTVPITFATGHAAVGAGVQSITPGSGLGSFEVTGNFITIGTSNGGSNQTFTSPYTRGDYIPALWVGSGNDISTYEIYVNVTGYKANQKFSPMRNGILSVGNGEGGSCFTQDNDVTKVRYKFLTGVSCVANSNFVICDSTASLVPGNKVVITGAGITVDTNAMVEQVLNSTTFTLSVVATGTAGTKYTSLVGVATPSIYEQFSTTLRFGDDVHGKIPPNGMTIKVPNIMITDYTAATSRNAGWSATDVPCYFAGTSAGIFKFNSCLFGESYGNYTQAGELNCTNIGFCYSPYVTECYKLTFRNIGFGSPPVIMHTSAITALGATGSCTGGNATITIPSSTAIRPGVLITGASTGGLRPAIVATVNSATSLTLSQQAHTNASTQVYSYYGNFIERDYRASLSVTPALFSTYTACQYSFVSNAIFDNCIFAYGGHPYTGISANTQNANSCILLTYSSDITITNIKVIRLGISQRNRPTEMAYSTQAFGKNHTITNLKAINLGVAMISASTDINIISPRSQQGIFSEGNNLGANWKSLYNPITRTKLAQDTKYWYKTRTYWTHDISYSDGFADGFAECGAFKGVTINDLAPRVLGVTPQNITSMSPTLAYGNGVWVGFATTAVSGVSMASADNGATWKHGLLPYSLAPWWKVIFVAGTINKFFAFSGYAATAASNGAVIAISADGVGWTSSDNNPAQNWLRGLAYDANATIAKFVLTGSSSTGVAGTVAVSSVDGYTWTARTQVSAITVDVAASGSGMFVSIAGGPAVGTISQYSTNGTTWAVTTGALASSLWQAIAYGSSKFVCISASATNGPTAYCADPSTTVWTAGTAPTLPAGANWQKILWTGSVFVIMSGCNELNYANATGVNFNRFFATSTDGITWSALKLLPENTSWIAMANNGNAVMFVATLTGRVAYTVDISATTPTFTFYKDKYIGAYNRVYSDRNDPMAESGAASVTSVATTAGSSTVTCASTAVLTPGTILAIKGFPSNSVYITSSSNFGGTLGVRVLSITNSTTFEVDANALFTTTGQSCTQQRGGFQIFRSETEGFTPSGSNMVASTTQATSSSFWDANVTPGTTYYYKIRKTNRQIDVMNCSGIAGQFTITTTGNFTRAITSTRTAGTAGTNLIRFESTASNAWTVGVFIGMAVTGTTGIPAGTVVTDIVDHNLIVLNNNLTTDIKQLVDTVYFSLMPGMSILGGSIGNEAKIVTVDSATQITVSVANSVTFASVYCAFYMYWESCEIPCIPQVQKIVQNNILQSQTMATSPWVNSGCTVTAAADTCPADALFGATNAVLTACSVLVTTINATNTQPVALGIGNSYTFSCFVRAALPQITSGSAIGQVRLSSGATSQTFDLTHKWQRISITFTSAGTNPTENVVITWLTLGVLAYVGKVMLTVGSDLPPPFLPTTTTSVFQSPQTLPTGVGLLGWNFEENGGGMELTYTQATNAFWYHVHLGTASNFTPSDVNQIYSNEFASSADANIYCIYAPSRILIDDYQPLNEASPMTALPLRCGGGASSVIVKDSKFNLNGASVACILVEGAFNIYMHNCDFNDVKNFGIQADYSANSNSSKGLVLQNCRSNNSRLPWGGSVLSTSYKGVFGAKSGKPATDTYWNFSSQPGSDGFPISIAAVYDSMFHELTFGDTGHGALDVRMLASTSLVKPYTLSGNAYFSNSGSLYFQSVGDQVIIEWPHFIKGVTGFDAIMPIVYAVDLCSSSGANYGIVVLTEYDLDKGSGYSNTWKTLIGRPDIISAETGINAATGFRIKFRLTARLGVKYNARTTNFIVGETLQNATSSPTATMVLDQILEEGSNTGTLLVSNVTGTWVTTNTLYNGATTRASIVATNNEVFMPQATSYIAALRLYTNTDLTKKYPFAVETLTIKVVDENLTPISGARVRIVATETAGGWISGDLIYTGVTGGTGILTSTAETSANVNVSIRTRKASASPFYKPVDTPSTITLGSGINTTIVMIADE